MGQVTHAPAAGIVADETDFAFPGVFRDGNNVRPYLGQMQTIGGWEKAHTVAVTGKCRGAQAWADDLTAKIVGLGTSSKLYVIKAGTLYDVTPTTLPAGNDDYDADAGTYGFGGFGSGPFGGGALSEFYPRTWSLDTWGDYMMGNPKGGGLYIWEGDTGAVATKITQAPAAIFSMCVTPGRRVIAGGCTQVDGTFNPMCLRGAEPADYTSWTPGSGSTSFEEILQSGSRIVKVMNYASGGSDYLLVFTDTALYLGQPTGNALTPYAFAPVIENAGLAGPLAAAVVDQTVYWLTPTLQFYIWQVGVAPQMMPCPIRTDFADNIDTVEIDKVSAVRVSQYGEVWWFYPDVRDGNENSRYVAYAVREGKWFKGVMARTSGADRPESAPLFVGADGYPYNHETGTDADGSALSWFVESSAYYIDEASRNVVIRGVHPDYEGQVGDIQMSLETRRYPNDIPTTYGPWTFTPATIRKHFMVQGKIISIREEGASTSTFMRRGKPVFDVQPTGRQ